MDSFEKIYHENYPKVYGMAMKMLYDEDVARDIVQDVFMSCYEKLEEGGTVLNPGGWLMRVLMNKCVDHIKLQKRHEKHQAMNKESVSEDKQEEELNALAVKQALAQLKPKERTLAVLYSEGLSYAEIAQVTGIKHSSVGKTLARTLDKLGRILKKLNYEMY